VALTLGHLEAAFERTAWNRDFRFKQSSTYIVKCRQVFRSQARCLTLLIADATPALQHLSIIARKHPTQSAFNSPSIGTEVFNSLLANNEPYISESDWAVGCFCQLWEDGCESSATMALVEGAKATDSEHVLESIVSH
jgi:hypothetical protein